MSTKFKIIVANYNNEEWTEYCLSSILTQTYTNWEVIFVDDASTDRTVAVAEEIIAGDPRFEIVRNPRRMGGTYNHMTQFRRVLDGDTVVVALDGDDWFYDITTLERLDKMYRDGDYWMTYGGMYVFRTGEHADIAYPQNTTYPDFVHEHKAYRRDLWRASHLRSWKAFLLHAFDDDTIKDLRTGEFYNHAADLALQFGCLEMCPKEKIGVIDFPAYIYNGTPRNAARTAAREAAGDAWPIEKEIRNRKHYKEGLSGERLPQINVFGYNFESDYIPKGFTVEYGLEWGEYDAVVITDFELPRFLRGEIPTGGKPVVADLHESREYVINDLNMNTIYDMVYDNSDKFTLILTHDPKLLTLPNARKRLVMWKTHLSQYRVKDTGEREMQDESLCQIYPKSKNISCVSSNKASLPGHRFRLETIHSILSDNELNHSFDMYGVGFNEIKGKVEALRDYRFSIVMENAYLDNWATEKIGDCFHTGTIPIYYGCPNIGTMFDQDGIITFSTAEELKVILRDLSLNGERIYNEKLPAVRANFERVKEYSMNLDQWFTKFIEPII